MFQFIVLILALCSGVIFVQWMTNTDDSRFVGILAAVLPGIVAFFAVSAFWQDGAFMAAMFFGEGVYIAYILILRKGKFILPSVCLFLGYDADLEACYIYILGTNGADSTQEIYDKAINEIKTEKKLDDGSDFEPLPVDHLAGNVAFVYSVLTSEEKTLERLETEFNTLMEKLNVTPEF